MNKLEITIAKADELISAMTRLAEAMENKVNVGMVAVDEPSKVADRPKEELPITAEQSEEIKEPGKEEKPVTLEQIRAVLTAKKDEGKNKVIKELLQKYGTTKLTAIDPAKYTHLLKEAEAL
ncbi:MAG: rRNA biogenesis protein rrp5 [Desulfosporosinus sp.]|nr:rRNA biogenesis protein rrp5 [Desulfosporosinus sp.]